MALETSGNASLVMLTVPSGDIPATLCGPRSGCGNRASLSSCPTPTRQSCLPASRHQPGNPGNPGFL